jgi:hypothetical protein
VRIIKTETKHKEKKKGEDQAWGYSSDVEHLPGKHIPGPGLHP